MMPQSDFSFSTTAEEVAVAFADQIRGKNVLITGTSVGGIGFETARAVALNSANMIIITGHNAERLKITQDAIKKEIPSANIHPLVLNLSSLAAVRKAAAEVNALPGPLHVLIHNAAAPVEAFKLTVDGLENQAATNHISPFLLTKLLAPKLLAARTADYTPRVVFVSAAGHAYCTDGVNFDTLENPKSEGFDPMNAYCQTKASNVMTAIELSKRSKGQINAYSLHPGVINTNLMHKGVVPEGLKQSALFDADEKPHDNDTFRWKTIPQGAATTVTAAFDPSLNDKPGAYLDNSAVANETIAPHASNPASTEKLWSVTEKIIGETFTF